MKRRTSDHNTGTTGSASAELLAEAGQELSRWMRADESADPLLGVDLLATRGRRLRYVLGVSEEEIAAVGDAHRALSEDERLGFETMKERLLGDEVLRNCCGGDTDRDSLRYSLAGYFDALTNGSLAADEAIERRADFLLRHRLLGLRFYWYLQAIDAWLAWLAAAAVPAAVLSAARRLALFDLGLMLMTYVVASRSRQVGTDHVDYGSPSRRRKDFISRVDRLQRAGAERGLTVVVVGIENLHQINTVMGHQVGDLVMQQASSRLVSSMRESDALQRIGVTELGLVLPGVANEALAILAAHKFRRALSEPIHIAGRELHLKPVLGIAIGPGHGREGGELFQNAELAMREATRGREGVLFFSEALREQSRLLYSLEGELRRAIEGGELSLVYQPQIELASGRCTGAEALVRWQSDSHGSVPPARFIPIAEQSGLIHGLTAWVVQNALRECATVWGNKGDATVSINVSAVNLLEPDLPELIARGLRTWDLPPQRLVVEITESAVMDDPKSARQRLQQIADMGVGLSIDDFGTGYSSLAYLKRLPVDELKIDRSFVKNMAKDADDEQIVRTIIGLGENFGLKVLAEGVEDEATARRLIDLGCARAQGYCYARPMPPAALAAFLVR